MDQTRMEATVEEMVERMRAWLTPMVAQAMTLRNPGEAVAWERRFREGVQEQAAAMMQDAWQRPSTPAMPAGVARTAGRIVATRGVGPGR